MPADTDTDSIYRYIIYIYNIDTVCISVDQSMYKSMYVYPVLDQGYILSFLYAYREI